MSLGAGVLSILLDAVIHDLKTTHSLGAEGGELSESTIRVDFRHGQFLQFGCDLVVQFILQIIIRDASFSSEVQEFREEVVKLVSILHVELLELVLCSGHLVWIIIDGLQVFNHVGGIFIWVHRFTLESGSDVLVSFSITTTSYVCTVKLRGVVVIMISFKLLGHQKKPVFKSGFLSIHEQWRIRDLS